MNEKYEIKTLHEEELRNIEGGAVATGLAMAVGVVTLIGLGARAYRGYQRGRRKAREKYGQSAG